MKKINILIFLFVGAILLVIVNRIHKKNQFEFFMDEYSQIENYQQAKELFESDLKNNNLKYFFFGLAYDTAFDSIKEKYDLEVFFVGDFIDMRLTMYNHFVETNVIKETLWTHHFNSKADSVWTNFLIAMETNDTEYLVSSSFEKILCAELNLKPESDTSEYYDSKVIFENYLDKLMHLNNLSTQKRTVTETDSIIYVNYSIESRMAEENGYNLIFIFEKSGERYLFKGMTMT